MLNRSSPVALYLQIAEEIAASLGSRIRPGERLPAEAELVARYGVSRVTVRQALAHLEQRGLVVRKQGKGTFAATPRIRQDLQHLTGFYDSLVSQGIRPETRILQFGVVAAGPKVQQALRLPAAEALHFQRQYLIEGQPLALASTHFHPDMAAFVTRAVAEANPSYTILQQLAGLEIGRADLSIRIQPAGRELAEPLGVRPSTGLLTVERTTYCTAGIPREHTLFYVRPEAYELSLTVLGGVSLAQGIKPANSIQEVMQP